MDHNSLHDPYDDQGNAQQEVAIPHNVLSDDQVLDYTQRMRRGMVQQMTQGGKFPQDAKEGGLLLQVLNGLDSSALGRKRAKNEERATNNQAGMQSMVASMLRNAKNPEHFMGAVIAASAPGVARAAPVLGNEIPDPHLVEGETSAQPLQESLEQFNARFESQDSRG